jgi:hypothetical protein
MSNVNLVEQFSPLIRMKFIKDTYWNQER